MYTETDYKPQGVYLVSSLLPSYSYHFQMVSSVQMNQKHCNDYYFYNVLAFI